MNEDREKDFLIWNVNQIGISADKHSGEDMEFVSASYGHISFISFSATSFS